MLDRRGSRFGSDHRHDVAVRVAAVLSPVGGVDGVVEVVVGFDELHALDDAAGADVALVTVLEAAEPGGAAPVSHCQASTPIAGLAASGFLECSAPPPHADCVKLPVRTWLPHEPARWLSSLSSGSCR